MAYPKPGELDQCCSQTRIAGFRHALLSINCSTLPRCRRQASIGGDLPSVVEMSEQPFRPQEGGELWPDAPDVEKNRSRGWRRGFFCGKQRVPFDLNCLDLLEQKF